jgi:hypothetical protein
LSYLLDTNVVSEPARARPSPRVLAWLDSVPGDALFISVLTLGEIRKGVEKLTDAKRREKLRLWLEADLPEWFGQRVLSIDVAVADRWGRMLAEIGRPVPSIDSLLAATALHHGLRLVTRNDADFSYPGLEVLNPWSAD